MPAPPGSTPALRVSRVLEFLTDEGCLDLGASRTDALGEDVAITPVDTDQLRGSWAGGRPQGVELGVEPRWSVDDPQFDGQIEEALYGGGLPEWALAEEGAENELWEREEPGPDGTAWGGWERCAWYAPFHTAGPAWGIYMREACLRRMAVDIALFTGFRLRAASTRLTHLPSQVFTGAAFSALYLHEDFHHRVESFAIRLHVASRTPHYREYAARIYRPAYWTDANLEEALANASMWRRRKEVAYACGLPKVVQQGLSDYLSARIPRDPPGYRMGHLYFADGPWRTGINSLAAQVEMKTLTPRLSEVRRWELAPRLFSPLFSLSHRIYTVLPVGSRSVLPTPTHPAPNCSSRELIRAAEKRGYAEVKGGKGSHKKLKRPGAPTLIIPGDEKSLSPGVIATALDAFGMRLPDLPRFLAGP